MKILDEYITNIDAWRLGEICHKASKSKAGDYIDTGLILQRLLSEKGYRIAKDFVEQEDKWKE